MLQFHGEKISLEVSEAHKGFAVGFVFLDLQSFINHIPDLKVDEPFYFGMWRVMLVRSDTGLRLVEWDYGNAKFLPIVGKSICLWHEQARVCHSRGLAWNSVPQNADILFTEGSFTAAPRVVTECVRYMPDGDFSGWMIYTDADRSNDVPFKSAELCDFLDKFDLRILRFLGLPVGWLFNIDQNGLAHIWSEDDE